MEKVPTSEVEAIELLRSRGYNEDLDFTGDCMTCRRTRNRHAFDDAIVDYTYRFEGESDPDDESIVLGITVPGMGDDGAPLMGVLISAYGADIDPAVADFLRDL